MKEKTAKTNLFVQFYENWISNWTEMKVLEHIFMYNIVFAKLKRHLQKNYNFIFFNFISLIQNIHFGFSLESNNLLKNATKWILIKNINDNRLYCYHCVVFPIQNKQVVRHLSPLLCIFAALIAFVGDIYSIK